jgi:hypothetical protein
VDEVTLRSYFEPYGRYVAHSVVLALEEAIEEACLQRQNVRRVVGRPLAASMRVEEAVL